jgi:DNA-binding NarL/FixJ family response regulator
LTLPELKGKNGLTQMLKRSRQPTPRERQVLELICEGYSTKQIAGLLGISFKTAACHRMRLMDKAEVHDPISLFRWALLQGYIVLDGVPVSDPTPTGPETYKTQSQGR